MKEESPKAQNDGDALLAPNLESLERTLDKLVFEAASPVVVAIKGGWGEGKTYFWKNTIARKRAGDSPGYISVFGADSIAEIRNQVVVEATASHRNVQGANKYLDEMIENHFPILRKPRTYVQSVLETLNLGNTTSSAASTLLEPIIFRKGWVVCIDDVERLSDRLDIESILGYVNSLRDDREVNVVLIYNEAKVNEDQGRRESLRKYLEKVVDREFTFAPDLDDVLSFVFDADEIGDPDFLAEVKRRCEVIGLRNIRILERAKTFFDEVKSALPNDVDRAYLASGLHSLLLFCWINFSESDANEAGITFPYLLQQSYYSEDLSAILDGRSGPEEKRSGNDPSKRLGDYGYSHTNDFDRVLIDFVRTSVLDVDALLDEYRKFVENRDLGSLHERFSKPWQELYHSSFQDNEPAFAKELLSITTEFLPSISVGQLDEALVKLCDLDHGDEAGELFERFFELRSDSLGGETLIEPIRYDRLRDAIADANARARTDNRTLQETIDSAIERDFIVSADRSRLAQFSVDQFVDYFSSTTRPHLTGILRHLVRQTAQRSDDTERQVHECLSEVVRILAGQSRINKLRLKSMGLDAYFDQAEKVQE